MQAGGGGGGGLLVGERIEKQWEGWYQMGGKDESESYMDGNMQ